MLQQLLQHRHDNAVHPFMDIENKEKPTAIKTSVDPQPGILNMASPPASPHFARESETQNSVVAASEARPPALQIPMSRTQQNFTLFPTFPFEIREKIWSEVIEAQSFKITIPEVEEYSASDNERAYKLSRELYLKPKARPRKAPALLHTCHEAREIGLKPYHLIFGDRLDNKPIYFNFELDTLIFKDSYILHDFCVVPSPITLMKVGPEPSVIIGVVSQEYCLCELQKQVRHLAFEVGLDRKYHRLLIHFQNLKTACFLKQHGWESLDSLTVEVEETNFVDVWKRAAIGRGQAFEKLPSVEHLDESEFYAKFPKV